jgi:hypothetical protein
MNLRLAGSDRLAPEPGLLRARGLVTRVEPESDTECRESFLGRGLMIRSDGLPLKEAAVMLMSGLAAMAADTGELLFIVGELRHCGASQSSECECDCYKTLVAL